jgi:hypothetical protein
MSQVSQLSPELGRGVLQLARAIVAATQQWSLYPPDHPAVGQALSRLALAIGRNKKVLEREQAETPEPARRDDLWRSIVLSMVSSARTVFDESAQERLLAIAGSAGDISELATAVMSDGRGDHRWAVVEAADSNPTDIDPLTYL